jgi:hypothetical protein
MKQIGFLHGSQVLWLRLLRLASCTLVLLQVGEKQ